MFSIDFSHHAYLLTGPRENLLRDLNQVFEKAGIPREGNPDFWVGDFDVFGIDDSRDLQVRESRMALEEGRKKIFIIAANSFSLESQNSLLKVFEEPTPGTYFFLLLPVARFILPTLRSRLLHAGSALRSNEATLFAKAFLVKSLPERLKIAAEITKEKNKTKAALLIEGVIETLRENKDLSLENAEQLTELLVMREYLSGRSPSIKIILEHAALIC